MFLGHFALALAAKSVEPRLRLGDAILAAQWPDVVWPYLVLTGVEKVAVVPGDTAFTPLRFESYPWSHSLLAVAVWAVLIGAYHLYRQRGTLLGAVTLGGLAVSHWLLDFLTHRPDMPLVPWSDAVVGLGLWNSPAVTLAIELALFVGGVALYLSATGGLKAPGLAAAAALVVVLLGLYAGNVLGPPPPGDLAIAIVGILAPPLFWAFANGVDRRRFAPPA
jgi:membrane-bound metal-dependent hydrolase YbcI (DUF457 family)